MPAYNTGESTLQNGFGYAANDNKPAAHQTKPKRKTKAKQAAPFCMRFTDAEREYLERKAGKRPLGTYCREVLLGEFADTRRKQQKPSMSSTQYAALLAALGESRLSSNLNQLAHHANIGTLDVTKPVEQELQDAYQAVIEMRKALLIALGMKP